MLTYTMDVEDRSRWIISTPSAAELAQPYFCSEVGDFYARDKFSTARSNKNSFILFYTLGGEGTVSQGGQTVRLPKGHALLMDCRTPQSYGTSPGQGHWYHLWAHIDGSGVELAGRTLGLPRLAPVAVPLSRLQPHMDVLFERLGSESVGNAMRTGLAVHALVTEVVLAAQEAGPVAEDDPVRLACAYVERHFAEKVTLDDLAREAAVSPSYLIRLFKRQLETTPHDYLLRYRISRAKELLAETTLTSAAIAERVGFTSESNFSYRFKQMTGQGPRAYRRSTPELVLAGDDGGHRLVEIGERHPLV
ncbi:MAG: helix-turn-helix transcriptional regulator [Atopobiaceae bacterium]|nr:helix-turn-helix transcriptional regulator [Atopobiaceae bacterium]